MNVGGQAIDAAAAAAFLAALAAALDACLQAAGQLEHGHDAALDQHRRQVEQARYHATRAKRRYRAVDPDNRPAEDPHPGRARGDRRPRRRPRPGVGRAHHHRQGPQAAAAHPAGGSEHHRPPRRTPTRTPS
jgi:hypothetical protein